MRTRLLVPHVDECRAMAAVRAGRWGSPWWVNGEHDFTRDARGRSGGRRLWLVLACNSSNCPARMIVNHDDVVNAIEDAAQEGAHER